MRFRFWEGIVGLTNEHSVAAAQEVGLAITVYKHRTWPYVWWFFCYKYRMYTVYTNKYVVLAHPTNKWHASIVNVWQVQFLTSFVTASSLLLHLMFMRSLCSSIACGFSLLSGESAGASVVRSQICMLMLSIDFHLVIHFSEFFALFISVTLNCCLGLVSMSWG